MKITEADVIWERNTDRVRIEHRSTDWQRGPNESWHHANLDRSEKNPIKNLLGMYRLFNTLVTFYNVPVEAVHKAFLQIDEYRNTKW